MLADRLITILMDFSQMDSGTNLCDLDKKSSEQNQNELNEINKSEAKPAASTSKVHQKPSVLNSLPSCSNYVLGASIDIKYDEFAGENHGYKEYSNVSMLLHLLSRITWYNKLK